MRKITALMDPNQNPNQLQDQETFDTNMAGWVDGMVQRGEQENALADDMEALFATMSATAAGGAYSFPYVFDSSTADSDPGVGKLRLSSATQNASTAMRMDLQAVGGADMTNVLADLRAATSAVKGSIRLVKMTDPSKWLIFDVSAVALPTGYRNLTMTWRATGGGLASPFVNGDALLVCIERSGDKGEDAVGALQLLSSVTVGSAVAQIDFLNIFSAAYDKYIIELQGIMPAISSQLKIVLAAAGAADTGAQYRYSWTNARMSGGGNISEIPLNYEAGNGYTLTVEVRNANGTGAKSIGWRGTHVSTSTSAGDCTVTGEGVYRGVNPASGFRLFMNGPASNIIAGTVRVYGVKNTI